MIKHLPKASVSSALRHVKGCINTDAVWGIMAAPAAMTLPARDRGYNVTRQLEGVIPPAPARRHGPRRAKGLPAAGALAAGAGRFTKLTSQVAMQVFDQF